MYKTHVVIDLHFMELIFIRFSGKALIFMCLNIGQFYSYAYVNIRDT